MSPAAANAAYAVAARALYGRTSSELVLDLRGVIAVLTREVDRWDGCLPLEASLLGVEVGVEGARRLLSQLRLALQSPKVTA